MDLLVLLIVAGNCSFLVFGLLQLFCPHLPWPLQAMAECLAFFVGYVACATLVNSKARRELAEQRRKSKEMFSPQVAGATCADCGKRIIFHDDGHYCDVCKRVYCRTCQPQVVPCSHCSESGIPADP